MRRALLLGLAFSAITFIEFEIFPGHTYLQGKTQLYVPMLERLDTPGFLSRDLVATHPNLSYTIYDEVTLFLHEALRLDFRTALVVQQVLCRSAAILAVYMIVCASGFGESWALLIATLVNLGAFLPGPALHLVDPEPLPASFAFALSLLASGCLVSGKPLLSGLAGGIAFLYDPSIAAVLWITVLIAFVADRHLRRLNRPCLTILAVFVLLLANLAQLQPGISDSEPPFGRIPADVASILQTRTAYVWVPHWAGREIWLYLAILVCGLWAIARIWPRLNRQTRWFFLLPSLLGLLSIPVSAVLIDLFGWWLLPRIQPARSLLFTVEFSLIACSIAGLQALRLRSRGEAVAWFVFVTAVIIITPMAATPRAHDIQQRESLSELAHWAETNTWGSSMFVFPDAGRDLYPGIFRAESRRALWVDWESGAQSCYSGSLARTWNERWRNMERQDVRAADPFPSDLPIDYYVLKASDRLASVKPAFANAGFVVYDSHDVAAAARER